MVFVHLGVYAVVKNTEESVGGFVSGQSCRETEMAFRIGGYRQIGKSSRWVTDALEAGGQCGNSRRHIPFLLEYTLLDCQSIKSKCTLYFSCFCSYLDVAAQPPCYPYPAGICMAFGYR